MALIAGKFKSFLPEEIACLSSAKTSNEDNYLMQKFARTVLKLGGNDEFNLGSGRVKMHLHYREQYL